MSEQEREALARVMWIARGYGDQSDPGGLMLPIVEADAILASDWLAEVVREAEQRGRAEVMRSVQNISAGNESLPQFLDDLDHALARHAGADQD